MTDSGESTGFSDTENKDENEEAKVSDQSPIMKLWKRSTTRKIKMHLVHLVRTLHLLILLQGTIQSSTLQYLILHLNYPSTPGMRQNTPDVKRLPRRTKQRRGPEDPPKLNLTKLTLKQFLRIY